MCMTANSGNTLGDLCCINVSAQTQRVCGLLKQAVPSEQETKSETLVPKGEDTITPCPQELSSSKASCATAWTNGLPSCFWAKLCGHRVNLVNQHLSPTAGFVAHMAMTTVAENLA